MPFSPAVAIVQEAWNRGGIYEKPLTAREPTVADLESQAISMDAMQSRLDYLERILREKHRSSRDSAAADSSSFVTHGLSPIQPVGASTPAPSAAVATPGITVTRPDDTITRSVCVVCSLVCVLFFQFLCYCSFVAPVLFVCGF